MHHDDDNNFFFFSLSQIANSVPECFDRLGVQYGLCLFDSVRLQLV